MQTELFFSSFHVAGIMQYTQKKVMKSNTEEDSFLLTPWLTQSQCL